MIAFDGVYFIYSHFKLFFDERAYNAKNKTEYVKNKVITFFNEDYCAIDERIILSKKGQGMKIYMHLVLYLAEVVDWEKKNFVEMLGLKEELTFAEIKKYGILMCETYIDLFNTMIEEFTGFEMRKNILRNKSFDELLKGGTQKKCIKLKR